VPKLSIPGGPRVDWRPRKNSTVRITDRLKFSEHSFPVTLELPRRCFGNPETERAAFTAIATAMVSKATGARAGSGVYSVTCRLPTGRGRLIIPRTHIPVLKRLIADLRARGSDPVLMLQSFLFARCCTNFVAELVATTPRGRSTVVGRRLTLSLPAAFVAVHVLVAEAQRDEKLCTTIDRIIADDDELRPYCAVAQDSGWNVSSARVVALVDRAFRGAWDVAGHPGMYSASRDVAALRETAPPRLRYRDPHDVLREHLYGRHREALTKHILLMKKWQPDLFQLLFESWKRDYLGEPGAAAAAFQFVARPL